MLKMVFESGDGSFGLSLKRTLIRDRIRQGCGDPDKYQEVGSMIIVQAEIYSNVEMGCN